MRPILPMAILAVLSISALAATAGPPEGRGHAASDHSQARWDSIDPAAREKGLDRAGAHHLFDRLSYDPSTGYVNGTFLRFHLAPAAGQFHDYTARDASANYTFFSAITPSTFAADRAPQVTGAVLHVTGKGLDAMAHNNPTAGLQFHAESALNLTFQLATGATILNSTAHEVKIGVGGIHGHVLANGNASIKVAGTVITVSLAGGDSALFRAHPGGVDTAVLHAQNKAFTQHLLGGVVSVADGGGQAVEDTTEVNATAETTEIGRGHIKLNVSSAQHQGRVLFLAIDGGTIDPAHAAAIQVTLGGNPVPRASSPDAVVSANESAVAFNTDTATGVTYVTVKIPHFSSYVLALVDPTGAGGASSTTSGAAAGSGSGTESTSSKSSPGAGLILVGVALLGAAIRRR